MKPSINPAIIKQFLLSRVQNQERNYFHPPFNLEQQLMDAIARADEKRAQEILLEINKLEGATLATDPVRSRKNSLIAMCTLFTRAIIKGGIDPETAFHLSDTYIMELEKHNNIEILNELEYEMLYHFIKTVKDKGAGINYSRTVRMAISYIYENILQELSLNIIAQHVFVHPSYLSSQFKKEVGISITNFINKKRIEESKYFLIHTDTSISDIALLFKFCNQSYYTSLFKKYNGMTPKEFRELKQEL
ncbi:AraC family transcriptional regulator [Bacillus methanolicus]|uniref:AraC family transcriptional regulator n=1 Tax=Bacillus methanolicus (strain MGA3 / ATCC 53907) TaxID=796606 RepID=I3E302_BACMM|nr:AraC family transcriptional regulator [Bacillus methanolicus]AIE59035.1 AraC family transcriptional regulator [Bacillus methanolicus MGA3]EIJ80873.1 transcriptional regulator, AraC family protein [Bacillus methanolicus MGA3]UQD51121.1 AraC family transcriptional regulator [Bacillus methanolicus]